MSHVEAIFRDVHPMIHIPCASPHSSDTITISTKPVLSSHTRIPSKPTPTQLSTGTSSTMILPTPAAAAPAEVQPPPLLPPRARGEPLPTPAIYSRQYDQCTTYSLGNLRSVPLRPICLDPCCASLSVRGSLSEVCSAVDSALASLGIMALAVTEGHMSFFGGVADHADVFTVDVYEDLLHIEADTGEAKQKHLFLFDALEHGREHAMTELATFLSRKVACAL